ncbi:uncharacterized protein LOC131238925 [Magnolia sinica]|uniref:uncharacterized protein LOC131238925 n=1 Tax=Magnolia sinica TaxID=86752 RepID=UPI002657B93D|nr:uncharacterized protein LOC131238925 [Magnolia sinica]
MKERCKNEEMPDWRAGSDGGLQYQGRVCISNEAKIRKGVMVEAHHSKLAIYPGSTKMYNDVKRQYWWSNMKRDIAEFVAKCMGNWDDHLALTESAYNNSYQSNIGMTLYEALFDRPYWAPRCWAEIREKSLLGPELVQATTQGLMRFGQKGKQAPRFIGPFEVLDRVGAVAYRLALPTALAGIHNIFQISMLKKYTPNELHVVSWEQIKLTDNASYPEEPIHILDHKEQVLRTKTIPLVKVLW